MTAPATQTVSKKKVQEVISLLLIEDSPSGTQSIQKMLADAESVSFKLSWAEGLEEAFKQIKKKKLDLILLDFNLAESDGIKALREIRKVTSDLPIIVLTGLTDEEMAAKTIQIGAQDYLLKNRLDTYHLIRSIRTAINQHQMLQEMEAQAWGLQKANEGIRLLYEDLKNKNEELERLDQLKSDFVSTVSHELRTPLSITKEGLGIVLDKIAGELNGQQEKILSTAQNNIDRLSRIINDLLDISRLESGAVEIKRKKMNLGNMIEAVASSFKDRAEKKGLRILSGLPKNGIHIFADDEKMIQVFSNLVSNALRFTEEGSIEISAVEKGNVVECNVTDTGVGIAKEDLPKLFAKFQQFGRTAGPGDRGTGLGLSIVKGIVELHKGKIWVESQVNQGTKFTFALPKITAKDLFKEYASYSLEEATRLESSFSLIVFEVVNFKSIQKKMGAEKSASLMEELERLTRNGLRRQADMTIQDSREILAVLPATGRKYASVAAKRIQGMMKTFLSEQEFGEEVEVTYRMATFPLDGDTQEKLLEKVGVA